VLQGRYDVDGPGEGDGGEREVGEDAVDDVNEDIGLVRLDGVAVGHLEHRRGGGAREN